MRFPLVVVMAVVLSACGHAQINYTPDPRMSLEEAVSTVEQVFLEDYVPAQRPDRVAVGPEYIVLSDGIVTRGSSVGAAAPLGNGAIALGSSQSVTREAGARLYYRSIGQVTLHARRFKSNRYAILIRNTEGAVLRRVNTTSQEKALRFIDALERLKQASAQLQAPAARPAAPIAI